MKFLVEKEKLSRRIYFSSQIRKFRCACNEQLQRILESLLMDKGYMMFARGKNYVQQACMCAMSINAHKKLAMLA